MLARMEQARPAASDRVLQGGVELAFAVGGAGGAGAAGFADIRADEDVAFEFRQSGGSFGEVADLILREFRLLSYAIFPPAQDGVDWQFRLCFRTVCSPLKTIWWPLLQAMECAASPCMLAKKCPQCCGRTIRTSTAGRILSRRRRPPARPFLTMSEVVLEKDDLELLVEELQESNFPDEESPAIEEAQSLATHVGRVGYIQLGFAHQGDRVSAREHHGVV